MARTFVPEEEQRAADIASLKDVRPTQNRVVVVDSDADGFRNQFVWDPSGEATNANGTDIIESNISEFADGGANEGVWRRVRAPVTISDDGASVVSEPTDIDFTTNISVTDDGDGSITVEASDSGGVEVEDSGTSVLTEVGNLNFGTDLDVTDDGDGSVTIDSAAGGGSSLTLEDNETEVTASSLNFASGTELSEDVNSIDVASFTQSDNVSVTSPETVKFSPDGTKMFVVENGDPTVPETAGFTQFSLSTPFDPSTATEDTTISVVDDGGVAEEDLVNVMDIEFLGSNVAITLLEIEDTFSNDFRFGTIELSDDYDFTGEFVYQPEESEDLDVGLNQFLISSATGNVVSADASGSINTFLLDFGIDPNDTVLGSFDVEVSGELSGLALSEDENKLFVHDTEGSGSSDSIIREVDLQKPGNVGGAEFSGTEFVPVDDTDAEISIIDLTFADSGGSLFALQSDGTIVKYDVTDTTRRNVNGDGDLEDGTIAINSPAAINSNGGFDPENDFVTWTFDNALTPTFSTNTVELRYSLAEFAVLDEFPFTTIVDEIRVGGDVYELVDDSNVATNEWDVINLDNGKRVLINPIEVNKNESTEDYGGNLVIENRSIGGLQDADQTNSFDVSGNSTDPADLEYGDSGNKLYVLDRGDSEVDEYDLSTAYDVSSASFVQSFDVSTQDSTPESISFSNDGSSLFVLGSTNDSVFAYTLSTAWDVSSASSNNSFDISTETTAGVGLDFNQTAGPFTNPGEGMYVIDSSGMAYRYDLSTAFDVSTASLNGSQDASSFVSTPTELRWVDDGRTLIVSDADTLYEFESTDVDNSDLFYLISPDDGSGGALDSEPVDTQDLTDIETSNSGIATELSSNGNARNEILTVVGSNASAEQFSLEGSIEVDLWESIEGGEPSTEFVQNGSVVGTIDTDPFSSPIGNEFRFDSRTRSLISGHRLLLDGGESTFGNIVTGGEVDAPHVVVGSSNMIGGRGNDVRGVANVIAGGYNEADSSNGLVVGLGNKAAGTDGTIIAGSQNKVGSEDSIVAGLENTVTSAGGASIVAGQNAEVSGYASFAIGSNTPDPAFPGTAAVASGFASVALGSNTQADSLLGFSHGYGHITRAQASATFGIFSEDYRAESDGGNFDVIDLSNVANDDRVLQVGIGDNPDAASGDGDYADGTGRLDGLYVTYRNGTFVRNGLQIDDSTGSRVFDVDGSGNVSLATGTSVNEISTSLSSSNPSDDVLLTEAAIEAEIGSASVTVQDSGTELQSASTFNFGTGLDVSSVDASTVTIDASGGSGVNVSEDGTEVVSGSTDINFGTGLNVTDDGDGTVTVDSDDELDSNQGTFSGDDSTTTFDVSHGLGATPSTFFVTAATDDASGFSHATAGSSNITVNYDTAPPSGTDNVVLNVLVIA